jgi:prepilin-type N-terminal cleavage/methylation domain-containing protein
MRTTNSSSRRMRCDSAERGFTLIELIVAVAILALMIGAAVPVTAKMFAYKARMATRQELQMLAEASLERFRDTKTLPSGVDSLLVEGGVAGWTGPYLAGVVADHVTGASGYEVDAWSRGYRFTIAGDVVTLASRGEDAQFGTADDLSIAVDVTSVRREETLAELLLLNQSIRHYNSLYQVSAPLSTSWPTAFNTLVATGFLPNQTDYLTDGWGATYEASGGAPLVELLSPTMAGAPGG